MNDNGIDQFIFDINENCLMKPEVNITLELRNTPMPCYQIEGFLLASWTPACEKMIGYRPCKVTNEMEAFGSCDFECHCTGTNGNPCKIAMMVRSHTGLDSVMISGILIHF